MRALKAPSITRCMSSLATEHVGGCRFAHPRIGLAMQELPLAPLAAEQVRHAQAHCGRLLLSDDAHGAALDGDRVSEIAAHAARQVLKLHRGAALFESRSSPVVARLQLGP